VTGAAPLVGRLGVSGKLGWRWCQPEEQSSAAGSGTEAAAAKGDTAERLLAAKETVRDDIRTNRERNECRETQTRVKVATTQRCDGCLEESAHAGPRQRALY
jgi:hypothetical protein